MEFINDWGEKMNQIKLGVFLSYMNILVQNLIYIIYTPLLIKFVGMDDFGVFQSTTQTINTLTVLSMGFGAAYIKFYSTYKNENEIRLLNGVYLVFYLSIALLALVGGSWIYFHINDVFGSTFTLRQISTTRTLILILTMAVSVNFISSIFTAYITAKERFVFQQSRILISTLIQPVIVIILLVIGKGVVSIAIVQIMLSLLLLSLNAFYALGKLEMGFAFRKGQLAICKSIFIFSSFLFINQMVDLVNNSLPNFLVASILGPASVAIYAVSVQIRNVFFQISMAVTSIFVPRVHKLIAAGRSDEIMTDLMIRVGKVQLTIMLFVYGGFILIGQSFIRLWAGTEFELAYWMIIIMIFPVLVPLSQNIGIEIQRAKNKHKFRSIVLGIFAIINIGITSYALPRIGVMGAIIGYVVSIAFGNGIAINLYNHFVVKLDMKQYWFEMRSVALVFAVSVFLGGFLKVILHTTELLNSLLVLIFYICLYAVLWFKFSSGHWEKNRF